MNLEKVKAIFTAASAMALAEERAVYLDSACAGDTPLRQQIESLLAAQLKVGDFLEPPFAPEPADGAEAVGTRIGPYKILEQIGEGGFGIVYMAEQEQPIRRKVALKIIKAGMDTKQVIARFEAERQALAMMHHPNIARVFDAGETDSRRPYFAMELVKGIPLTEFCDHKKLDTHDRLELFIKVCHAVQHAHQKGVIHRDLKPSNVMITMLDGEPVPKVIDFGVAKAVAQRLTERTLFTRYDQIIGTPAYMSPEQAELSGHDVDTRSDIYSLGVLLYELLTGTPPIDAETLRKAGLDEIRRLIRDTEPPRPSTRITQQLVAADVRGLRSKSELRDPKSEEEISASSRRLLQLRELIHQVRGDLDWVVMKCLEKDRARRYPSANDLAGDLQRYLKHEPVMARPSSRRYRLRKFVRRNRIQVAFGASVAAALVLGLAFALVGFAKARHERDRALAAEQKAETRGQKARTEAARSAQVAGLLKRMLKGVGPSAAQGRDTTMLREVLEQAGQGLQQELAGQPEVEADLRSTLGDVYLDLGDYTNAAAMHSEALRLRKKVHGGEHLDVAASLHKLAGAREMEGDIAEAERLFRQSLAIRRKLLGNKHPDVASTLNRLASTLQMQGGSKIAEANRAFAESEMLSREFLATGRTFSHNEALDVARAMSRLTVVLLRQGRYSEAEEAARQALTFQRKMFADNPLQFPGALGDLIAALLHKSKWTEAEPLARELLAINRKRFGNEHEDTVGALAALAQSLNGQDRPAEAETVVREELAIREKLTPGGWMALNARSKLGVILAQQKKYDQAEPLLLSAYEGMTQREDSGSYLGKARRTGAIERVVQFYEETGKTKEAAEWKQKLANLSQAQSEKAAGP